MSVQFNTNSEKEKNQLHKVKRNLKYSPWTSGSIDICSYGSWYSPFSKALKVLHKPTDIKSEGLCDFEKLN